MLGAIAGDVIGSVYEFNPLQKDWNEFQLFSSDSVFTDDTIMTVAFAEALRIDDGKGDLKDIFIDMMHAYGRIWPNAGYGGSFRKWLISGAREPYNSFGNGSAMRVSPAGWAATNLEHAEILAAISAEVTHNHPDGIKGAQAVAGSIYLARKGKSQNEIRDYVTGRYQYDLSRTLHKIKLTYKFDETCQGSVPEAIIVFLESKNFEEAIRKAIWLGGDADTQAAIAGSIAEAFYGGVPSHIASQTINKLDEKLKKAYTEWTKWLDLK